MSAITMLLICFQIVTFRESYGAVHAHYMAVHLMERCDSTGVIIGSKVCRISSAYV